MAKFHRITTYAIIADSVEAAEQAWDADGPECGAGVEMVEQTNLIPGACVIAIVNRREEG